MILFGSLIIIILGSIAWFYIWSLIHDPEAPFELKGHYVNKQIDIEHSFNKIRAFFNASDAVFVTDIMSLLGVDYIDAKSFLDYLVEKGEIEMHGSDENPIYTHNN
jgi:hypothetical protein